MVFQGRMIRRPPARNGGRGGATVFWQAEAFGLLAAGATLGGQILSLQGKTFMPHIIVLDDLSPEGLQRLAESGGITHSVQTGLKGPDLRDALLGADGAICRSGVKITADELQGNRRLRAIVRAGVGTDNIDSSAATRCGIIVMNTPAGNTTSTAEHTMALMLALSRNVAPAHASLVSGKWDRKSFQGTELRGKTVGVIGLGRIGQAVARRCRAFEMNVIGFDPFLPGERAAALDLQVVATLEELLPRVDYLTVHTPLTAETAGIVNSERLGQLKPGVRLINCARGGIFDEAALAEGLKSGRIAGVALDVFENEPCTDSPLFGMPGVLVTPHLGASTEEAQVQVATEAADLLVRFLVSGEICHAVNTFSLDMKTLDSMKGQLNLAWRLGILAAQLHGGAIEQCELELCGSLADSDSRLLSGAFCAGLLGGVTDRANLVNAEMLCAERGTRIIRSSRREHGTFNSLIAVTVRGEGRETGVAGTLFGKQLPRLVRIDQFQLEAYLDGHLLVFHHRDVPGIVGFVGQHLASHNVNIAQMTVGRSGDAPGGESVGVLSLDSGISAAALQSLVGNDDIRSVRHVTLPDSQAGMPWS